MIINTELANALKFQAPFDFNNNMVHYSLYFSTIYFKKFQSSNMAVKIIIQILYFQVFKRQSLCNIKDVILQVYLFPS